MANNEKPDVEFKNEYIRVFYIFVVLVKQMKYHPIYVKYIEFEFFYSYLYQFIYIVGQHLRQTLDANSCMIVHGCVYEQIPCSI